MAYLKLNDGSVVELVKLEVCSRGGGFVRKINADLVAEFDHIPPVRFQKMQVQIGDGFVFEAWADPSNRWNGWLQPFFERAEAERLVEWEVREMGYACHFDEANDEFLMTFKEDRSEPLPDEWWVDLNYDEEDVEQYGGFKLETPEGKRHVYPIGSGSWVWSEAEEES